MGLFNFWKAGEKAGDFAGRWFTTFGPLELKQEGTRVEGSYFMEGKECSLTGAVAGGKLGFRYQEPSAAGEGWFRLDRFGKFSGCWRQDGAETWRPWEGRRGFDGIWESSFGPLRLIQEAQKVHGYYEGVGRSSIEGRLEDNRLVFRYQEPKVRGEGWFELAEDQVQFQGAWRPEGVESWSPWVGRRIMPVPDLMWLVVIEAYWQRGLAEKDYAFGNMLREFFARVPHVEVRQRFFTNEDGLEKWCREVLYIPEPVALVLATHGTPEGLAAHGETIGPRALVKSLQEADNVCLLHFSSCLMMEKGPAANFTEVLRKELPFPLSGYATSVDWAASALIEFTYLDMILARGLPPEAAAAQVTRLLAFAGDQASPGSPYPPAQFRFWKK